VEALEISNEHVQVRFPHGLHKGQIKNTFGDKFYQIKRNSDKVFINGG
jgi:hypothetical protein